MARVEIPKGARQPLFDNGIYFRPREQRFTSRSNLFGNLFAQAFLSPFGLIDHSLYRDFDLPDIRFVFLKRVAATMFHALTDDNHVMPADDLRKHLRHEVATWGMLEHHLVQVQQALERFLKESSVQYGLDPGLIPTYLLQGFRATDAYGVPIIPKYASFTTRFPTLVKCAVHAGANSPAITDIGADSFLVDPVAVLPLPAHYLG